MKKELLKLRKKIDLVDAAIKKNLKKREVLIKKVGKLKKKFNLKIEDKKREREILKRIKNKFVKKIFKIIIKTSKDLESVIMRDHDVECW